MFTKDEMESGERMHWLLHDAGGVAERDLPDPAYSAMVIAAERYPQGTNHPAWARVAAAHSLSTSAWDRHQTLLPESERKRIWLGEMTGDHHQRLGAC